jgi:LysM repeat protein
MVCSDCIGLIKGFFWTNGGQGVLEYIAGGEEFKSKYGSNNCPDKGANGMLTWLKSKGCKHGLIDSLPDVPGILLFKSGHVGVYIGGGLAIEAEGFAYGVVETKVSKRPWTEWAYLPESMLVYDGVTSMEDVKPSEPVVTEPEKVYAFGERTLKHTSPDMKGEDVKELQKRLNALGFDCGTADGIFGSKTENGVIAFQTAAGIEVDGKFGKESFAALSAYSTPENEPESDDAQGYATYVVQRGDTLWNLAKKLLGRGGRWTEIAALNSISGTMIRDGQVLKIPA